MSQDVGLGQLLPGVLERCPAQHWANSYWSNGSWQSNRAHQTLPHTPCLASEQAPPSLQTASLASLSKAPGLAHLASELKHPMCHRHHSQKVQRFVFLKKYTNPPLHLYSKCQQSQLAQLQLQPTKPQQQWGTNQQQQQ